jgi:hypothetical protein
MLLEMSKAAKFSYGLSSDTFVSRKAGGDSLVLGGLGEDSTRWIRVLSPRAAQMLWLHLARLLYPDKSDTITALIVTAPLRDATRPTITTHMTVDELENGGYEIAGWINGEAWETKLNQPEAERLWAALDTALYPVGWQGQDHKLTPQ